MSKQLSAREMKILSKVLNSWVKTKTIQKGLATSMGRTDIVGSVEQDMSQLVDISKRLSEAIEEQEHIIKEENEAVDVISKLANA